MIPSVRFIDSEGLHQSPLKDNQWDNELHPKRNGFDPKRNGFAAITAKFVAALRAKFPGRI